MKLSEMKYITLGGDNKIPVVGLGTWQSLATEMENAVIAALEAGYRHFDTAFNYHNEEAIGNALKKWIGSGKGTREDLFITTKLPHIGNRAKDVSRFLKMSLQRLQLTYVDLYLIHMPFGFICNEETLTPLEKSDGGYEIDWDTNHIETWKAMEEQVEKGLVKNIGLSNFNETQICNVYNKATKIKPSVLQIEVHAYMQQKQLRNLCKELGIAITAFSPLGSPGAKAHFMNKYNYKAENFPDILNHPVIMKLAEKYQKTTGQILLRHLIQHGIIVIPKSANSKRLTENISIFDFDLLPQDVTKIDALDQAENGRIFNFLFFKGIEQHPEYPF